MISIIYDNDKVKSQCTSLNAATRFFGGNKDLARHLLSRIFAINNAECLTEAGKKSPILCRWRDELHSTARKEEKRKRS